MKLDLAFSANVPTVETEAFTSAMSRLTAGVTIVTTDGHAGREGRTVSAACSISASPPILMVSIHRTGNMAAAIIENGSFSVNGLKADQHALANIFAGFPNMSMDERFEQTEWGMLKTGAPVLSSCVFNFDCTVAGHIDCATHRLVLGAVVAARHDERVGAPLLYGDRAYFVPTPLPVEEYDALLSHAPFLPLSSNEPLETIGQQLLDRTLPHHNWTHAGHIAATLYFLKMRPDIDVARDMPGIIRRYNSAIGIPNTETSGYHETLTQFYIKAVSAALKSVENNKDLYKIFNEVMTLPLSNPNYPLDYYTRKRLYSKEARRQFVEPDLKDLDF